MLSTKGRYILKAKILTAFEEMAYYQELRFTLGDHDIHPCTKAVAEVNYMEWRVSYLTLESLAKDLCPSSKEPHQWLGITERNLEVAKTQAHRNVKWYSMDDDTEEIPF